jgi:hypothetical protein
MFQMSMYAVHSVIDSVLWHGGTFSDAFGNPDHQSHQSTCTLSTCKLQIVHNVMLDVERESTEKEERAIA